MSKDYEQKYTNVHLAPLKERKNKDANEPTAII